MKKKRVFRFLSHRVIALTACQCVAFLALALAYATQLAHGAPLWPLIVSVLFVPWMILLWGLWIVRPYLRLEHMMELFLDGYTLSGISQTGGVTLAPTQERLVNRMKQEFDSAYLLKLSKRQAQYRALQNQINPHFLYNTLESIRSEALIAGLRSVAEMTEALAVFFRYTISKVENLVTVEEELQNCETYFRIQQYRFGARLELHIEVSEEDRAEIYRCRLPKLTLQPILENSIIHGTEAKIGAGHLAVHLERTQKRLLIRVSDDGVGMDEATLSKLNEKLGKSSRSFQDAQESRGGVALVNVNNRIHLLFGEEYGLAVYSMPGVGTDVHIALPIITSNREVMNAEVLP